MIHCFITVDQRSGSSSPKATNWKSGARKRKHEGRMISSFGKISFFLEVFQSSEENRFCYCHLKENYIINEVLSKKMKIGNDKYLASYLF